MGLALATACSGTLNAALLFKGLYQQDVYRPSRNTGRVLPQAAGRHCADGAARLFVAGSPQWGAWSMGKASLELTLLLCLAGRFVILQESLLALGIRPRHLKSDRQ